MKTERTKKPVAGQQRKRIPLWKAIAAAFFLANFCMVLSAMKVSGDTQRNVVLVGDSWSVYGQPILGYELCGEGDAGFDRILELIERYDWQGVGEVQLLWGIAENSHGTPAEVVEEQIDQLVVLLYLKGVRRITTFRLAEMKHVLLYEPGCRGDELHLTGKGYQELYRRKGIEIEIPEQTDFGGWFGPDSDNWFGGWKAQVKRGARELFGVFQIS